MLAVLACASGSSGCAFKMADIGSAKLSASDDVTGSITPAAAPAPVAEAPSDSDMAFTRNAVSDALARGGKDFSQPWENPETGAHGSVTPLASAYTDDGRSCRAFLASFVKPQSEAWLQGEACKAEQGRWEIRSMKPWARNN